MHRQQNKCVFRLTEACSDPNTQNYINPSYEVFGNWKDASKTILPKFKITNARKLETMSELEKNIIQPCLRTQATSALLCLFMVPICWFPKFFKQTINCRHCWLLQSFAISATGAGAAPPVVGLTNITKKLLGTSSHLRTNISQTSICKNLQPHKDFESIIYSPLGSGKCSNHNNTERETSGEKTNHTKILNSLHQTVDNNITLDILVENIQNAKQLHRYDLVETHITNCCSFSVVQKRDKVISRMRHNCTKYTSNVSTSKTDTKLQPFAALILWLWDGMLVDLLNNGLKRGKFHHSVCKK